MSPNEAASLGPYPILQLAAAILVLLGVGVAVWRGMRDKEKAKAIEDELHAPQRWFFDGPLKAHLEVQQEIAQDIKHLRGIGYRLELEKIGEELRKQTALFERLVNLLERRR